MGIGGHVELYPLVRGAAVAIHHVSEVLASAESLGHALRHVVGVRWCMPPCPGSSTTFHVASIFFFLKAHQPYLFFYLHSFFFTFTILIFLSKHKILKIKEFQLKYLKFLEFKILQNFKFSHPNTL